MKHRCLHAFVVLLSCLQAGISGEAKKSDDAKNIQGTWKVAKYDAAEALGVTPVELDEVVTKVTMTFDGKQKVIKMEGEKKVERKQYRLYTDRPGVMDLFIDSVVGFEDTPKKGQQCWPAIYQLDGDTLKICQATRSVSDGELEKGKNREIDRNRPRAFKADERNLVIVLKRAK